MKKVWFVYRAKSWHDNPKIYYGIVYETDIETAAGAVKNSYNDVTDLTLRALDASLVLDSRLVSRVTNGEVSKILEGATKIAFKYFDEED